MKKVLKFLLIFGISIGIGTVIAVNTGLISGNMTIAGLRIGISTRVIKKPVFQY